MRMFWGAAALVMVAGCQAAKPADPAVEKAWVRLPAVQGNPGAAFLTIRAGNKPLTLLSVSAPFATRTELHESMAADHGSSSGAGGHMMTMAPVKQIDVPAGETVKLAPGGKHVMLYDVAPGVQPGAKVPLTLVFADGSRMETQAITLAAGDAAPE
ncbi:copper chaperone PCu(A)C [Sphingomonas canadensis]|uniref:Copper chaperone PCu(A)C n=1 Tax=Sphingomonas canadensis TaxID=1219257 RepID=A0ABW3H771_9SPHN|nr:copper chaperone PCu(A)C [Sphingomonas canadensis]MCW3835935.1 copper chaperone PCu(A)C [Sphingomonas canadensis]